MKHTANGLSWSLLLLLLVLPCLFGLITPYLMLLPAIFAMIFLAGAKGRHQFVLDGLTCQFLFVFAALAVSATLSAEQPSDALNAFNFAAMFLFLPMLSIHRLCRPANGAKVVGILASLGTIVCLALVVYESQMYGVRRPGWLFGIGPIRLSATAIILSFLSLMAIERNNVKSWSFLAMPLVGILVAYLTGTRGTMLTIPVLLALASTFVWTSRRQAVPGITLICLVFAALVFAAWYSGDALTSRILQTLHNLMFNQEALDNSSKVRLALYTAGWSAFLEAPWVGHGWGNLMQAVRPHMPSGFEQYAELPHLHNDFVDFAVASGVLGVLCYLLILVLPIFAAIRSRHDAQYAHRLYGTLIIVVAYLIMGQTNLMFGFEFHTGLYFGWLAIVFGYCSVRGTATDAP